MRRLTGAVGLVSAAYAISVAGLAFLVWLVCVSVSMLRTREHLPPAPGAHGHGRALRRYDLR